MLTPQAERAFKRANESAEAYALKTTNLHHAEVALKIAKQYKYEPTYIQRLEAYVEQLRAGVV